MRPLHILFTLLALAATMLSYAQNRTSPTGIVTGHVFCGDTNGPARLATVMLEPADAIDGYTSANKGGISARLDSVQTLTDGSFAMPHVAPGTYYVFATFPGYVSPLAALGVSADQISSPDKALKEQIARVVPRVTVQPGAPAAVDVTLQRGAIVSGTVLYDDGSPAPGLDVRLLVRQKDARGEKWVEPRQGPVQNTLPAKTDDRGAFRIPDLPAREYLLAVQLHVAHTTYNIGGKGYSISMDGDYDISIYSGNKLRSKEATPFTLKLEEDRPGEDITVPLAKLHRVSGFLTAARDGHSVNGGKVSLLHADDRSELASTELARDDTGWTLSFVPEGDYILRISNSEDLEYEEIANGPGSIPPTHWESHATHHYAPAEQPVHVEGDLSGLAISVPEPVAKKNLAAQ